MEDEVNPNATAAPDDNYWSLVPAPAPVDTGEDVRRSIAAQGTLGVTADVPGMIGGITQGVQQGARWLGEKAFIDLPNLLGADLNKEQIRADIDYGLKKAQEAELSPSEVKDVEEGRRVYAPMTGTYATPQYYEEKTKEILPYTQYEAVTPEGKLAGSASRFATGAAATAPFLGPGSSTNLLRQGESTIARAAAKPVTGTLMRSGEEALLGGISGLGSEAAGEWAKENAPEYEGWARFAGSMVAPAGAKATFETVKPWVMPKVFADDTALKLLAEDFKDGTSAMTPEQLNKAIEDGLEPTVFDLAGPKTREWLEKNYKISSETMKNVTDLNNILEGRPEATRTKMRDYMEETFGKDLATFKKEELLTSAKEAENNAVWASSRANPAAASLKLPELNKLRKNNGTLKQAFDQVVQNSKQKLYPSKYGVNPTVQNLSFWQQVKTELDDTIRKSKPNKVTGTGDTALYNAALDAKENLLKILDDAVPEYGKARDSHSALLGLDNSVDAGEQFAKLKKSEDFKDYLDVYKKYTPDQQELFKRSFIRSMYDDLGNKEGSLNAFVTSIKSPKAQRYYREVLGDQYDDLVGRAVAQQTMDRVAAIKAADTKFVSWANVKQFAQIGGPGFAGGIIQGMMEGSNPSATTLALYATTAGLAARNVVLNAGERRIAPRVTALMKSQKPEDIKNLGKLIQENPDAFTFIEKINKVAARAPLRYVQSQQQVEPKPEVDENYWQLEPTPYQAQASGGRVERKAGGRVGSSSICAEVNRTRLLLGQKTASMLSMPDDAIVSALHIAKTK